METRRLQRSGSLSSAWDRCGCCQGIRRVSGLPCWPSENEEKEGGDNRDWEDLLDQAMAVRAHSTWAYPVDRIRRRQRCYRHFPSRRTVTTIDRGTPQLQLYSRCRTRKFFMLPLPFHVVHQTLCSPEMAGLLHFHAFSLINSSNIQ